MQTKRELFGHLPEVMAFTLDPEIKRKWLEALRGGEYRQAKGGLFVHKPEAKKMCCIGVLGDVQGVPWDKVAEIATNSIQLIGERWHEDTGELKYNAGIPNAIRDQLAVWNDGDKSFANIADWIEENL